MFTSLLAIMAAKGKSLYAKVALSGCWQLFPGGVQYVLEHASEDVLGPVTVTLYMSLQSFLRL